MSLFLDRAPNRKGGPVLAPLPPSREFLNPASHWRRLFYDLVTDAAPNILLDRYPYV